MKKTTRYCWLLLLTDLLLIISGAVVAAPFIPTDEAQILETINTKGNRAVTSELRQLRAQLARQPTNLQLATALARRYINQSRAESDPRYLGYAQSVLTPWWTLETPPTQILVLRAIIAQSSHHFEQALADLSQALQREPSNAQAWLTRSSILRVVGNYQESKNDCSKLFGLSAQWVVVSCISGINALNGQLTRSYELLRGIYDNGPDLAPAERLWVLTDLAEMAARAGKIQASEAHFRQALALDITDSYLLGAYADFLLDQHRPAEVVNLLESKVRADGLLLRLALAEQQLNLSSLTERINALRARFEASRLRGDTVHRREEARFTLALLKNSNKALQLAQENWAVQREPWDARILLKASLAAKNARAARPILDWIAQRKLEDVQITQLSQQLSKLKM